MKSISFAGLFVSTLVVSASAIPHYKYIFGRGDKDTCYTGYGKGTCGDQKTCKGISVGKKYCGGGNYGGDYQSECCVELVCSVPAGKGYCRSVKNGGCPGGSFHSSEYGDSEWPCTGDDIQCCVQGPTPYPPAPGSNNSTSGGTSGGTGGNGDDNGDGVINKEAVEMLKELEGFRGDVYHDQIGVKTIGYGHNCESAPGTCEALKKPISEKEAEDLMMKDLEQFEKCVCDLPNSAGLNKYQFSAMVSFAFNTGCYGLKDYFTGLMSKKDYEGICKALSTTNTLGGVIQDRRASEAKLCSKPTKQTCGCKGTH